jgi:hypothetical protein
MDTGKQSKIHLTAEGLPQPIAPSPTTQKVLHDD